MSVNDLAGGGPVGSYEPELLYAGEAPIITDAAVAAAGTDDIQKYEVLALDADGLRRPVLTGEDADTGRACVIAAQPAGAGQDVPYFAGGKFNHEVLVWPAELDTYEKRRAFFHGTDIHIGRIAK